MVRSGGIVERAQVSLLMERKGYTSSRQNAQDLKDLQAPRQESVQSPPQIVTTQASGNALDDVLGIMGDAGLIDDQSPMGVPSVTPSFVDSATPNTDDHSLKDGHIQTWRDELGWVPSFVSLTELDPSLLIEAIETLATSGIVVRTAAGVAAARQIAVASGALGISNGDGVAGNPTISISAIINAIAALAGTGLLVQTGAGTVAERTITPGSANLSIANGNGVSGNPTIDLNVGSIPSGSILKIVSGLLTGVTPANFQIDMGFKDHTAVNVTSTTGASISQLTASITLASGYVWDYVFFGAICANAPSGQFISIGATVNNGAVGTLGWTDTGTVAGERTLPFGGYQLGITGDGLAHPSFARGKVTGGTGTVNTGWCVAFALPRIP